MINDLLDVIRHCEAESETHSMTVADFMQSGSDAPLYIQAAFGRARVIGIIARQPRPQVIALTDGGASVFLWALWSTQLEME